ncbi:Translation elongation factor 4, mitochondrial [Dorcoceras hygrometricum]|uniref:Translation elongation factor 4, mitochondrial n=1 Tax=Dorcoceras hygrometricum TaxID=472368 RepID=A0A2Z7DD93_9LAMI|nr:Translation elongation factor 4, mitochondrial [Dorcoceras hygrometricum]
MRRPSATHAPPPLCRACSGHRAEEFTSVLNSSILLVKADEGVLILVMDLIRRSTVVYLEEPEFPCESGWSQAPRCQQAEIPTADIPTADIPVDDYMENPSAES